MILAVVEYDGRQLFMSCRPEYMRGEYWEFLSWEDRIDDRAFLGYEQMEDAFDDHHNSVMVTIFIDKWRYFEISVTGNLIILLTFHDTNMNDVRVLSDERKFISSEKGFFYGEEIFSFKSILEAMTFIMFLRGDNFDNITWV